MFTINDIIIEDFILSVDSIDYNKSKNDLFNLITEIIKDLNITSLKTITINQTNILTEEKGIVRFEGINKSHIEFCRKVFAQFNNESNDLL